MTMQVVGLCRFSYLGKGGFKVEHDSLDDRRSFLYAPERMEERFRLFEAVTLPSVLGQTDKNFSLIIATGTDLPKCYLERLNDLTARAPQIQIRQFEPGRHRPVMSRVIREARHSVDHPYLQFRLDDDDAMGVQFVERFRETADDLKSLWSKHERMAVDFNKGFIYRADESGLKVWPYKYQYSAIALGMIVQAGCDDTIMGHGHHKLWSAMPTVTFTDEDMMMRGHNDHNDSRLKSGGNSFEYKPLSDDEAEYFRLCFNVDDAEVRRVFARPAAV